MDPVSVNTAITFICNSSDAWQISSAAVSAMLNCAGDGRRMCGLLASASRMMRSIICTASTRIGPGRGFGGKHQRIAAVEHGIGHVGSFGARGARILRHGFEHLRRGDHRHGAPRTPWR